MADGIIAIDDEVAKVILGALAVADGESLGGTTLSRREYDLARLRLIHGLTSVCPQVALSYEEVLRFTAGYFSGVALPSVIESELRDG